MTDYEILSNYDSNFLSQAYQKIVPITYWSDFGNEGGSPGIIYFVSDGYGTKIGVNRDCNIERRLSNLQLGNSKRIILIAFGFYSTYPHEYIGKTMQLVKWESAFHRKFEEKKLHGEWFLLDDADIHALKNDKDFFLMVDLVKEGDRKRQRKNSLKTG